VFEVGVVGDNQQLSAGVLCCTPCSSKGVCVGRGKCEVYERGWPTLESVVLM